MHTLLAIGLPLILLREEGFIVVTKPGAYNPEVYSELLLILESYLDVEDSCDTPFLIKDNIKIIL